MLSGQTLVRLVWRMFFTPLSGVIGFRWRNLVIDVRNNWIDELRLVDVQKTHLGMRMYFVFLRKLYTYI